MPIYMSQTHCITLLDSIVVQFQITFMHINVGSINYNPKKVVGWFYK